MNESELRTLIQSEIKKHLNVILSGESGGNSTEGEGISNLFPGMPEMTDRPVMHPYGYTSRSTRGVLQVTGKHGEHVGNRVVLGHRDKNRPKDLSRGESVVYSNGGLRVYLRNSKIQIGSSSSADPAVLYDELKVLLETILENIIAHTHVGNLGVETTPPLNGGAFSQDKSDIETIQSLKIFLEK